MPVKLLVPKFRRYSIEWNCGRHRSTTRIAEYLRRQGLKVKVLGHKTAMIVTRPWHISLHDFWDILRSEMDPKRGTVMVTSDSGACFVASYRGNQTGRFIRQM